MHLLCVFSFSRPPVSFQGTPGGHRQKPRPPYYGKRQPLGLKIPNSTKLSLCLMTSFAKKMRPGVDFPREAVSYSTARAVLGRRALFQMAFSERQGGVSRPANGTVDSSICIFHILSSPIPPLSLLRLCAGPPEVSRTFSLFLRYEETKKTCHKRVEWSCAWAPCPDISNAKSDRAEEINNLERSIESWGDCSDLPSWRSFVCGHLLRFWQILGMKQAPYPIITIVSVIRSGQPSQ